MTNTEIIQAIRNEIERQRKFIEGMFIEGDNNFYDGQDDAYNNILTFLSTLESEKPMQEGLEEEIVKVCDDFVIPLYFPLYGLDDEYGRELINKIARHFAKWGAEHLKK